MVRHVHILAADIGGSNSRFAHFSLEGERLRLHRLHRCPTAFIRNTEDALEQAACLGLPSADGGSLRMQVWGVAGPVLEPLRAQLTNVALTLDLRASAAQGLRVLLLNDFAAQAWASLALPTEELLPLLPGAPVPDGPRGIVGAGTGLGTASLLRGDNGRWTARCAEAGHTAFPFRDGEEARCAAFFRAELGTAYISAEQVLSGRGLELLYRFLGGEAASARQIAERCLHGNMAEPPAVARWFGRFYGRMCRHWALSTLCTGGLYVTGGLAVRNPLLVTVEDFAAEYYDAPAVCGALLRRIPVWLVMTDDAGLWGAARAGQAALRE